MAKGYTTNIPLARKRLHAVCQSLRAHGLSSFADQIQDNVLPLMTRQITSGGRVYSSEPMTKELAISIREFRKTERGRNMSHMELAQHFNVNVGRISEVLS